MPGQSLWQRRGLSLYRLRNAQLRLGFLARKNWIIYKKLLALDGKSAIFILVGAENPLALAGG
jgi:hypothetical protein